MVTGPHEAHRQDPHRPMQYDTGRPNSVIRLRISQSRTTSLPGPAGLRARRPSPMTDARLAPPARPPAPESAVACRSGGFQARLGPCVPWKPPDIDPIGHPHVVFRVDWTTPDDPARSRVIPRRTGYQHVWSASAEGAQPLGMEPRSGPARARVRPRRPALLPRVPRSLAGSYPGPGREPRRTDGRCPAPAASKWRAGAGCRASLRGGASHEVEGRGGARGGGSGRVGPLAGWHRLRLLRQIGDELVSGVEQFLLVDDVVAVENGPALVPGQEHGDPLGDAGADQVARGGAPAIVEEAGRHPGRLTGGAPRRAPAPDGDAVAVEHSL